VTQLKYWLWLANLPKLNNQMKLALRAGYHANKAVALDQAVHQEVHGAGSDHASGDGHTQDKH